MRRGRKVAIGFALFIWLILLAFTFYFLYDVYSSLSEGIPASEVYSHEIIEAAGEQIILKQGDIVSLESNGNHYSFKLISVDGDRVELVVNNFLYIWMNIFEQKKIDLNADNIYDVAIHIISTNTDRAAASFLKIEEKQNFVGGVSEVADKFSGDSRLQSSFMMLLTLISLLILIAYIVKAFIVPHVEEKRKMARKSELETFDELYDKFDEHKSNENKDKAKRIFDKASHLYRYMSKDDKADVERKMAKMAKYLK